MAESPQKKSSFGFLQSAQSRVFLAIGIVVVAITAVALIIHWHSTVVSSEGAAAVTSTPDIASTPGAGNPSAAYVKAQTEANIAGAAQADKNATAFIPTITRPGFVGDPGEFGGVSPDSTCPISKTVVMFKPNPASCTIENLKSARESGVTAEELMCQGCACPSLKLAGYTAGDLKQIGLTAAQLHTCGFDLQALLNAGFGAAALKEAGFSNAALRAVGFTPAEIAAADAAAKAGANCDVVKLQQERAAGVSAAQLKSEGCGAAALRAAGFSAAQLKEAGFSAAALKDAGFSATELKAAGFSAAALKSAGFTNADLSAAGFSPAEIAAADKAAANCDIDALKKERAQGYTAAQLKEGGCGAAALKAAGFSAAELKAAGYSASELKDAGFSAAELKDAGFSPSELQAAGFPLASAVCDVNKLQTERAQGMSAAALRNQGCSLAALKAAGFSAAQLKAAGFSAGQLKDAGFSAAELKDAGFSAAQLRDAGYSASELKKAGFSAAELKAAGYTKGDLLRAGYSPEMAGFHDAAAKTVQDPSVPAAQASGVALPSIGNNSREARLAQFEKQQQADMNAEQRANQIQRTQAFMEQQAQKLMSAWSNVNAQQMQKAPVPKADSKDGGEGGASKKSEGPEGPVLKAGTVLFATIDSSINSDVKSPILARIVAGPMTGSRLMGSFTRQHKELLIQFTLLNDPHYIKSIPINAVAIDANTARTALSGQVNNHYLLRYGTLFASSFLQGFSAGIINQGVTSDCLFGGFGCTLKPSPLSVNQQVMVGMGQVGQAYAQHMGQSFNRPPTIRIAAGTGIGILLMGDLILPANPQPIHSGQDGLDSETSDEQY